MNPEDCGTRWRWETEESHGPWTTKAEASESWLRLGGKGYIRAEVETLEVDQARWAQQDRERMRG